VEAPHGAEAVPTGLQNSFFSDLLDPFPYIASPGETAPSLFIAEAGRDARPINTDLARLREAAVSAGWRVEYWNHPTGPHAFDVMDPSARSRAILMRIREFLEEQLQIN
jgi:hypothetical protein